MAQDIQSWRLAWNDSRSRQGRTYQSRKLHSGAVDWSVRRGGFPCAGLGAGLQTGGISALNRGKHDHEQNFIPGPSLTDQRRKTAVLSEATPSDK